ncbi:Olfactory receptor 15 [Heterocephalus glaber]|uniref:Olfactory receptor 15 n=1 Tax=Heterocephalus glaber TaxID=10181 RepID=G5AT68_HETGA|nr:Olfactory receptor 15 [Heterocephalus glaber]
MKGPKRTSSSDQEARGEAMCARIQVGSDSKEKRGNSSIILLSLVDPRLHIPMYFFLDNLSLLDLSLTCTIVPQLLANLWGPDKTIAAWGCITQPLRYMLIMHPWMCVDMAAASWSSGLAIVLVQDTLTLHLPFCGHHTLDHFFCEIPVFINLACGDTTDNKLLISIILASIPLGMVSPLLVVISYTFIARAVLKLPSAKGRHKALSTCSSHLLVVTTYFGPAIYLYLQPSSKSSQAKFMPFFCCIMAPVLNPLIYTLRNKDVKTAWKRVLQSQGGVKSIKARRSLSVS